jgi:hypothetical protein
MNGRYIPILLLVLLYLTVGPAALVQAEDTDPFSLALDGALNSKYVWRGLVLADDLVLQPSIALAFHGLTASLWGSLELTDSQLYPDQGPTAGEFTETDLVLDYTRTVSRLDLSLGFIHYRFPNTGAAPTTEVYGVVALPVKFSPAVTFYRDVDQAPGTYMTLSVGHQLQLGGKRRGLNVDIAASAAYGSSGYHAAYYGLDEAALSDAFLTVSIPLKLDRFWTLTPSLGYSMLIDSEIKNRVDQANNLWFGLSLSPE